MFKRRILTQIFAAFITLAVVFVTHQANTPVTRATIKNLSDSLATAPISQQDTLNQKLQQILDNQVAQGVPGVTMYIRKANGWTWSGASGFSNVEKHTPMKASDRFRIMSITKSFVATVVLQLAQEGKLGKQGLDTTIDKLLPANIANRIPNRNLIKVRHLLNHTSGLFNYVDNERYERETFSEGTLDNVIDWAFGKGSKPPAFAPGTRYEYCDTNAIIAELIVQHVTGNPLAVETRRRILTPLKLKNTYMERIEKGSLAGTGFVHGYNVTTNKDRTRLTKDVTDSGDVVGTGDGGLISNAEDLARFAAGLFHSGTLLNQKFFNQMVNFNDHHVGLGVFEELAPGMRIWGHSGRWHGYSAQMYFLPDNNLAAAAMANTSDVEPGKFLQEALKVVRSYK
ncbi:MAG TPA: serine hydrolase domain-containing protein [Waterburya sp.]|jgi:D-alanyl-D-alanine carboxypeptidase